MQICVKKPRDVRRGKIHIAFGATSLRFRTHQFLVGCHANLKKKPRDLRRGKIHIAFGATSLRLGTYLPLPKIIGS